MHEFPAGFYMKKIEAIIDTAALDAIKLHLAEAGIDGRGQLKEENKAQPGLFARLKGQHQNLGDKGLKVS
jgi:hypothetical protein